MKPYLRSVVQSKLGAKHESDSLLRVLTYNVLSQKLITRDKYPDNGKMIQWDNRFPVLSEEIESYRPDLLFLQEVDRDLIYKWEDMLDSIDMTHVYYSGFKNKHGILIAWESNEFDLIAVEKIDYDLVRDLPLQIRTFNIGLLLVVKRIDSDEPYVVGTTHMHWHPDANYERFRQAAIFVDKAAKLRAKHRAKFVIFGADFNSTPESTAYNFFTNGLQITDEMKDALQESLKVTSFGPVGASPGEGGPSLLVTKNHKHITRKVFMFISRIDPLESLNLISCYKAVLGEEPEFTNWTADFRETIDYIFISGPIFPQAVLELPSAGSMGPEPSSLPRARSSQGYPSDHLALMAELVPPNII